MLRRPLRRRLDERRVRVVPSAADLDEAAATFAELTGKSPRSFLEWATDYAAEFRA